MLFLYSQGLLNRAARAGVGAHASRAPAPDGGRYEFVDGGAILHAEPNPLILYQMIARPPQLSAEDQVNSTLHFYRELNRLGLTSAVDAGGGGHVFPEDYAGSQALVRAARDAGAHQLLPVRPDAGRRRRRISGAGPPSTRRAGTRTSSLEHGFELEGGGEFLAHSAGDWENFLAARPDLEARRQPGRTPRRPARGRDASS